jgi:hypothetical protein
MLIATDELMNLQAATQAAAADVRETSPVMTALVEAVQRLLGSAERIQDDLPQVQEPARRQHAGPVDHVPLPMFDGTRAREWLQSLGFYFHNAKIVTDERRLEKALCCFTGPAVRWVRTVLDVATWSEFMRLFHNHYDVEAEAREHAVLARRRILDLKQTSTVAAYARAFRDLARDCDIHETTLEYTYMKGLKKDVRYLTNQREPKGLDAVIRASIIVESLADEANSMDSPAVHASHHVHAPRGQRRPPAHAAASAARPAQAARLPKLTPEEKEELTKIGGCFRCRQPGHFSHQCPTAAAAGSTGRGAERRQASDSGAAPSRR